MSNKHVPSVQERSMGDPSRPDDRRVQRTRGLLLEALAKLISERGYERLTIQTILDEANIGRATFYAHFESKDALLEASLGNLRAWLVHQASLRQHEPLGLTLPLFEHLKSHSAIYHMSVGRRGEVTVGRQFRVMLRALIREEVMRSSVASGGEEAVRMTTEFLVGSLWSTVVWWMKSGQLVPAEEMDRRYRGMVLRGIGFGER
jgi:AcrR family transcriptional regulator